MAHLQSATQAAEATSTMRLIRSVCSSSMSAYVITPLLDTAHAWISSCSVKP